MSSEQQATRWIYWCWVRVSVNSITVYIYIYIYIKPYQQNIFYIHTGIDHKTTAYEASAKQPRSANA